MTVQRMTRQIVVRLDEALHDALLVDAAAYGRTPAQSIRFLLRKALADAPVDAE